MPVAVAGSPSGEVAFSSTDPTIAGVSDGLLSYGGKAGAAVVVAESVCEGSVISRRYIQVDVQVPASTTPTEPPQLIKNVTLTGYVEEMPDETWHFMYFKDWFTQWGGNIRVQGELAITLELDRHYWLYFDVWGEIESFGARNHDTLNLYLNDTWKRRFNPTQPVIYPAWDLPCVIPRRTEWVDLWEYIGRSVVVRFRWDTVDAYYQTFDGWHIGNIRIVPPGG